MFAKNRKLLDEDEKDVKRSSWAKVLKHCLRIDVMVCGKCGGKMRALTEVKDYIEIQRYLQHVEHSMHRSPTNFLSIFILLESPYIDVQIEQNISEIKTTYRIENLKFSFSPTETPFGIESSWSYVILMIKLNPQRFVFLNGYFNPNGLGLVGGATRVAGCHSSNTTTGFADVQCIKIVDKDLNQTISQKCEIICKGPDF